MVKMLKPTVKEMQPRIKMLRKPRANRTGRDADARRTLPLNGSTWQKLRAMVLRDEPRCVHCLARGLIVMATDVDHRSGDPSDNSRVNLQSLCHECHSRKTAAERGMQVNQGCDADGLPMDPAHPWNAARHRDGE